MSFLRTLWPARSALPASSRYISANGVFYLVLGAGFLAGAGPVCALTEATEGAVVTDVGLVRLLGMCVAVIGWFYVIGGRTGDPSFVLATVVDRFAVPFVLVAAWWFWGVPASLALPLAVLDPALAVGALLLWRREAG